MSYNDKFGLLFLIPIRFGVFCFIALAKMFEKLIKLSDFWFTGVIGALRLTVLLFL